MKKLVFLIIGGILPASSWAQALDPPTGGPPVDAPVNTARALYESIVRIENSSLQPDYRNPWNAGKQGGGSGTGFLIGDNLFMTNAHVVSNNIQTVIKKYGDPEKYVARIVHIAHDCDLAVLQLEEPSSFEGVKPLEIGPIPKLESTVTVIGYPMGGQRLSTTRGVVSRIDFLPYSHSSADLHLTIQIDAAINPGNSGGPVMQDGKVVGVAFQGMTAGQNVGYMIPTPVMQRFLKDVEDGSYDNYVDLSILDFDLINPAYRKALGLPPNGKQGTLVADVITDGSSDGTMQPGDVLLSINGHPVASNGYVEINGELVDMNEIVERKFKGDKVDVVLWRDGKEVQTAVTLKSFPPYRMQANRYDEKPRYVMFAGFVFQPLDRNLIAAHKLNNIDINYMYQNYVSEGIFKKREDVVVITSILPDAINSNHNNFVQTVVDEINGRTIRNIADVAVALEKTEGDFIVVKCKGRGLPLVLDASRAREAHDRIRQTYRVGKDSFLGDTEPSQPNEKKEEKDEPVS